jgi:hypothetical protein
MRAGSPPTARPIATAAVVLVAAVLVPFAITSPALAERWLRPVPGEVARPFLYARAAPFSAGAHRGVDLVAPPGTAVAAACGGRVVHAGPVAGQGGVVSVRCGSRRVSYLPLARVAVDAGSTVRRGVSVGTVAAGHGGLHLGARREGDPFGYEDPTTLLEQPPSPSPPTPPVTPRPRPALPRRLAARESIPRIAAPRVLVDAAARSIVAPSARSDVARSGVAPWPVWAGLGLLLVGAAGSGTVTVRRRRLAARRVAASQGTG